MTKNYDRTKQINKLQEKLKKSKSPKSLISNYGYKKYLSLEGESSVTLNKAKHNEDAKWDGLHGIITNNDALTREEILDHYRLFIKK